MMKYRRIRLRSLYLSVCTVLMVTPLSVVSAELNSSTEVVELSPWSISGAVGVSRLAPQENNSGLLVSNKQSSGYSLALDYLWKDHFLFSGFYVDAGRSEISSAAALLGNLDYQYIGGSFSWMPFSAQRRFSPYLKTGLHSTQNSVDNPSIKYSQDQAVNSHFGLGAAWKVNDDWRLLLDLTTYGRDAYFASLGLRYQLFNKTKVKTVLDQDGDGIPDNRDRCLTTASDAKVDAQGCAVELDSDGDGIPDSRDSCLTTAPDAKVDAQGCAVELDSDGDGVPDSRDCCPNTPLGNKVDAEGCAIIEMDLNSSAAPFEFGSEKLSSLGEKIWAKIAKQIKQSPNVIVELGGHTDSKGSAEFNRKFSLKRANSVERFLVGKGVQEQQLRVKGYGESQPIADNSSEEGRRRNRRVDAHIVHKLSAISEENLPSVCKKRQLPMPLPLLEPVKSTFEAYGFQVLSEPAKKAWRKVAQQLKQSPQLKVELAGYTDSSGASELNLKLSQQRAEAVRDYLLAEGVDKSQVTAKGYGEKNPIADNSTPEGRKMNRRVEIQRR